MYQQAMDAIKQQIASGELSGRITLGRIQELTGTTIGTARKTANELVDEGVLESHPGAPYTIEMSAEQVADLQTDHRPAKAQLAEVRRQVAELRGEVPPGLSDKLEWIVAAIENLYERAGWDIPEDGTSERGEDPAPAAQRAAASQSR
jgi:DNA-binding transcriptional regulator YhcF (GntR family)